jgi:hypothetical protein
MIEDMEVVETPIVQKKRGRKAKLAPDTVIPPEELASILMAQFERMSKESQTNMATMALELRKPTVLEQKKLDEEHAQLMKRASMSVEVARQKEATEKAVQAQCPHKDKLGDPTFWGQVNSDGRVQPFCSRCGLKTDPWKATPDQISNGVLIRQWKKDLTVAELNQYAKYANQVGA